MFKASCSAWSLLQLSTAKCLLATFPLILSLFVARYLLLSIFTTLSLSLSLSPSHTLSLPLLPTLGGTGLGNGGSGSGSPAANESKDFLTPEDNQVQGVRSRSWSMPINTNRHPPLPPQISIYSPDEVQDIFRELCHRHGYVS